jgi:hypothetical protein
MGPGWEDRDEEIASAKAVVKRRGALIDYKARHTHVKGTNSCGD